MAYQVPAELFEFYAKIKTPLAKRVAILILDGKTANASYRQACKEFKRKPAKDPRKSAHVIATNADVARFLNLAKASRADVTLNDSVITFNQRAKWLKEIVELKMARANATEEPVPMSDAVSAIRELNLMFAEEDRFTGMTTDELRAMASK